MNKKWVCLLYIGLVVFQAHAQQAENASLSEANAANKERLLKGGKISPRQQMELKRAEKAETNLQTAQTFLAANKLKAGVLTLASGVQYKTLKAGTGKKVGEAQTVRCFYQGTLADGSRFDSEVGKTPLEMKVDGFVPGLKEAVKLMPAGSKWEIVVPPQLGYGAQGDHAVAPHAVLIYEMEIIGVL